MDKRYWSPGIRDLKPYVPGEQLKIDGLIKLNTNENPYPPSASVLKAINDAVTGELRRYPDAGGRALRMAIAQKHKLSEEQIFVGNGSDEVLGHIFLGLMKNGQPVLFPDISYSFYPVYCGLYGIDYRMIAVDENFEIDIDDYRQPNGGIIITNPNAPTGIALPLSRLRELVAVNPDSVVVIDEAYVDFGGESTAPLINEFDNLLVVHTFSKAYSLAGLRVGFAMGHPVLIAALNVVKDCFNSYPVDRLALAGAEAAIKDIDYFKENIRKILKNRNKLTADLTNLGFEVLPSETNFVLAHHPRIQAKDLCARLRDRKILVRHFPLPRISDHLRITVGTPEECNTLALQLNEIIFQTTNSKLA